MLVSAACDEPCTLTASGTAFRPREYDSCASRLYEGHHTRRRGGGAGRAPVLACGSAATDLAARRQVCSRDSQRPRRRPSGELCGRAPHDRAEAGAEVVCAHVEDRCHVRGSCARRRGRSLSDRRVGSREPWPGRRSDAGDRALGRQAAPCHSRLHAFERSPRSETVRLVERGRCRLANRHLGGRHRWRPGPPRRPALGRKPLAQRSDTAFALRWLARGRRRSLTLRRLGSRADRNAAARRALGRSTLACDPDLARRSLCRRRRRLVRRRLGGRGAGPDRSRA